MAEVITALIALLPPWAWCALIFTFVGISLVASFVNGWERQARRMKRPVPAWLRLLAAGLAACAFQPDKAIEMIRLARRPDDLR